MTHNPLVPLGFMSPGECGTLEAIKGLKVHGERCDLDNEPEKHRFSLRRHTDSPENRGRNLERRLNCMGLVPGTDIKILQNSLQGPIIVIVKDSRLCLERAVALKLMVRPVECENPPGRIHD
jgi:Fe2+ transport system protein FeoA